MVDKTDRQLELDSALLQELDSVAQRIVQFAKDYDVWLFEAQMGGGKTTLIKAVCSQFEVEDVVTSPTFSLVNEYRNHKDDIFYHFDFYRIKNEMEAMDIGSEEYFYSGNYCFVEWSSKIPSLLPDKYATIELTVVDEKTRSIKVTKHG